MTPTVTRLHEQGRDRVRVELDGKPWRVLPAGAVVRAGLRPGTALDRETARRLAREIRRAGAIARAGRALAARDRSRGELDDRLASAGVPLEARAEALAALADAGLVDDSRVAALRAQELARRGYGNIAIRHDLERRRVPAEAAAEALAGLEAEADRARRFVGAEAPSPRMLRRLSSRGFSRDTIAEFADEA